MCGIAGFIDFHHTRDETALKTIARAMGNAIAHRGPDGHGEWADASSGIAFAHRRLAVIDLSPNGAQPMHSANGRYSIVFNGEIYNFQTLKAQLKTYPYRGGSDTETMLAAFECWGVDRTLQELNGMFALALWDRQDGTLHLARDRMGKKPLYYGWAGHHFLFGSELKALHAHPEFSPAIDRNALTAYVRHNYVPAPWSIYRGIHKLPPGRVLSLRADNTREETLRRYWDFKALAESGQRPPAAITMETAANQLESTLDTAVRERMVADVPLGAFLSGGIDSSLVVALMCRHAAGRVKTFSIGFSEEKYNEAESARTIARHLGTDHTEFTLTPDEARSVIPALPEMFDEPFADSSQIPTYHVARLARQHVTVALSGDGGDESFGGYRRYAMAGRAANALFPIPQPLRRAAAGVLRHAPVAGPWRKLFDIMDSATRDELYRRAITYWPEGNALVKNGTAPLYAMSDPARIPAIPDFFSRMMAYDTMAYLPDDILAKVDRATMAVALEARAPLLDYRVVEFAWTLPPHLKMQGGVGKPLLRHVLERHVPRALFDRPKQGFAMPVAEWLRGPLRDWAGDLLNETRLRNEGFFDPAPIRRRWREHLSGRDDWSYPLWGILMFQAWHARWHG